MTTAGTGATFTPGDAEAWQKYYFLGKLPDGSDAPAGHTDKLRAADRVDRRGSR